VNTSDSRSRNHLRCGNTWLCDRRKTQISSPIFLSRNDMRNTLRCRKRASGVVPNVTQCYFSGVFQSMYAPVNKSRQGERQKQVAGPGCRPPRRPEAPASQGKTFSGARPTVPDPFLNQAQEMASPPSVASSIITRPNIYNMRHPFRNRQLATCIIDRNLLYISDLKHFLKSFFNSN
jgi:hypothetical protein